MNDAVQTAQLNIKWHLPQQYNDSFTLLKLYVFANSQHIKQA